MRKCNRLSYILLIVCAVLHRGTNAFSYGLASRRASTSHEATRIAPRRQPNSPQRTHLATSVLASATGADTPQATTNAVSLSEISDQLSTALEPCVKDITKTCKVKIAPVAKDSSRRLGLVATQSIAKGDVVLAMPYDERFELVGSRLSAKILNNMLPETYDSWTGDCGLIALQILNEVALASNSDDTASRAGLAVPNRPQAIQEFMTAWVSSLPSPSELDHPLLWSEDDQEILQSSSTNKIYKLLDDIEEDALWLVKNVFDKSRTSFPEQVAWNGRMIPCFNVEGFKWAMALSRSRTFFLNGALRLIPFLDMCNHGDDGEEIRDGFMGTFGTTKGAVLVASKSYKVGDEVICSYGPKSAADYLLEHGFCPEQCWKTAVSEITVEVDPEDRFYDDKLDILEYETYDQKPMDPAQTFDVISAPGRDGEPDKALIQFLRLCKLGGTDAFLLESIFRQEVWGFMELPVSEKNELDVVNAVTDICQRALNELLECPVGGSAICKQLRESETKALSRTIEYMQREKEALDLKEYYQERRLKDLGLDSAWSPEDDADSDLNYGQRRAPGGADYDW
jgi:[ribulose-bisphosphate carboxylase]/[fructose-bisphosphate aldolase]-lysine N-methyltransferase